jgi:hypothetical protein
MTRLDRKPETEAPPRRRRRRALLLLPLLLLFIWWLWPDGRLAKARALQTELFSEASQSLSPDDRRAKFEALRDVTRQMSESQRRQLSDDMRKRREDDLRAYTQLSAAEKKQRLDKDIDRMEQRRQQAAANGNPAGGPRGGQGGPGGGGAGGPGGPGGTGRPATPEDRERRRQLRLDQTTPEFRELTDQYRRDMAARRQERGLPPIQPRPPRP